MKDRITVLAGAALSLLLVYVLLTPQAVNYDSGGISRPTSIDAGDYGLLGLKTWLANSGIRTLSWRNRYERLPEDGRLPPQGNFLITSLPHGVPARMRELQSLREWLAAGNFALVLAAEYDSPDWMLLGLMRFASLDTEEVLSQFGFEFRYPEEEKQEETAEVEVEQAEQTQEAEGGKTKTTEAPGFFRRLLKEAPQVEVALPRQRAPAVLVPILEHSRLRAVEAVETRTFGRNRENPPLTVREDSYAMALGLLKNSEGEAVFWEALLGDGGIWLSAHPDLFGNLTLGMEDNSKLLANMLAFGLQPGGYVVFDDFHFGISDVYDPQAFFADKRLHSTLFFILGFWIVYLLGYTNRLSPPAAPVRAPRASDFVETLGGLFARRLSATAVARGLIGHFFNEVRALYRQPENAQPAWDLLAARFARGSRELDLLRAMVAGCDRGRPPKMHELISVLQKLRNELQ